MSSNGVPDPEDFFADTRMSFGDHIEDLRSHLWRAIKGFLIALVASFFVGKFVLAYITAPVKAELFKFHQNRVEDLKKQLAENDPDLQSANAPTAFVRQMFWRPQLEALLKGAPASQVNAMPRPVLPPENGKAGDQPTTLEKLLPFLGKKKEEPRADEKEIPRGEVVELWMASAEPLREVAARNAALRVVGDFDTLTTLRPEEAFMVWFKVCLVCGLVLGSPWIFYQIWSFVAAGLYPHEKRLVHVYLPVSLGLFLVGVFVCEVFVIPQAINALLWFNDWMGYRPDLRLNEWLGFAIFMPVIFGLSFQTPLVMLFLAKIGIMDVDSFRNKRRIAWFVMAVFAAVITPSTDALSMLFLWVPMSLLFELGIFLIRMSPKPPAVESGETESEELIEV
jgi:sec-independent protein translocase protein TatC